MNLAMLCIWLISVGISFRFNPDLFSPSKFIFLVLGFDFFSIFSRDDYHVGVYLAYVGYIILGLLGSMIEGRYKALPIAVARVNTTTSGLIKAIWLITLLPIMGQIGLIIAMGGFVGYVNSISMRVYEWAGHGIFVLLVKGIIPLHLLYFASWRTAPNSVKRSVYMFHGAILLSLAILSGSRGFLLGTIVSMLVIIHYMWRPIKLWLVLPVACVIFLIAGIIGVARTDIHMGADGISTGYFNTSDRLLETSQLGVGCFVINHVLTESSGKITPYMGTTFLSIVTTFFPRAIYPNKLETGGQIATKYILGDAYQGTSNYTPGILAESILNFGFIIGPIFAYIMLLMILVIIIYWYRWLRCRLAVHQHAWWMVVLYVSIAQIPANLLRAEWTNTLRGPITWICWILVVVIMFNILKLLGLKRIYSSAR